MSNWPWKRWYALLWLAGLLLLAALGAYLVRSQQRALWRQQAANLQAICNLKARQIAAWRAERLGDAGTLAVSRSFAGAALGWLGAPEEETGQAILEDFRSLCRNYGYEDVVLVDERGVPRLSLHGRSVRHPEAQAALEEAWATGQPVLTELHREGDGPPHLAAIAPLLREGRAGGAVVLWMRADSSLFPVVQSWPVPSRTAETLLVRREGDEVLFLNELRHRPGAALRLPLTRQDLPEARAVLGDFGVMRERDYREVKVLAAATAIPGSTWFLVSKVDQDEVLATLRREQGLLVGLLVALALAGSAAVAALWQRSLMKHLRERLALQSELHATRLRHEVTLMSIGDAVIATDRQGRVELLNEVAARLIGWPQGEAVGRPLGEVFRIVNEETRQAVEDPVARVLREGEVVGLANHTLLLARDGREIPIADSGAPIRGEDGEILGVVLVFRDQTAERAAAAELQEREETFRTLFEDAADPILLLSGDRFVACNQATADLLQAPSREAVVGLTPWDISPDSQPDGRPSPEAAKDFIAQAWQHGLCRFYWLHLTFKGVRIMVEVTLVPITAAGQRLLYAAWRDVTARVRAEEALRESEGRFRELFLAHPLPMWVYDLHTLRFLEVNDAAVAKYGYSRDEFLGMTLRDIRPVEDIPKLEAAVAAIRQRGGHDESSGWRHLTKDGRLLEVVINAHNLNHQGRAARFVVVNDVTERRRLERQLAQAQRMEAIGTLAGGIAHDFNNLLQAMLTILQTARLRGGTPPFAPTLDELEALVRRGADLVRQLLLFARQQPSERRPIDLAMLVREQAGWLRRLLPENIHLEAEVPEAGLVVEGDPAQLGQVLANLAVNARDAMPDGGSLTLAARPTNGCIELEVRDTGVGIPAELQGRIFDPFFSTKPPSQGTGLGLAVVWGIVEQHGGRIQLESEPGRGTLFRVTLPSAAPPAGPQARPVSDESALPVGAGERVLVVEDEEIARQALAEMLQVLGYHVTAAANAEEALRLPTETHFDLLLTDYLLPRATGLELAASLARRWPELRVIVMSGYAPEGLAQAMFITGSAHYLQKPFDMFALARALRGAFGVSLRPPPPSPPQ